MKKLDILVFGAHPDDVELGCGGTIIKHVKLGYKIGVIDLTQGELGTRGNKELRKTEAENAASVLQVSFRENLQLRDGFFEISEENKLKIIQKIRQFQPDIVITNAFTDRHIDHGRASTLVSESCFLSGLAKIETENQTAWRPKAVYHYIQDRYIKPDFIVDISDEFEEKMKAINCFESQFYNPNSKEPTTPISGESFLQFVESRAVEFGRTINAKYGEGFCVERTIGVSDILSLK